MDELARSLAEAIIGIDTLWGGDVMCASGAGRFIADSWFADEPLPHAYTASAAARLRETGGVSDARADREAVNSYLRQVDIPAAIASVRESTRNSASSPERDDFIAGLAVCLQVMWDLAMEMLGKGHPVPYERCVESSTGKPPQASQPQSKRACLAELLGRPATPPLGLTAC